MTDLKHMTVRALRELARKYLGPGYSRLKTKSELVAALAKHLPRGPEAKVAPAKPAKPAEAKARPAAQPKATGKAAKPEAKPAQKPRPTAKTESKPAQVVEAAPAVAPVEQPAEPPAMSEAARAQAAVETRSRLQPRDAGAPEPDEPLGELPRSYGDDAVVLLPRDPHTLWIYWDFAELTARQAREGMRGARAVLRLFDGEALVREVAIALEARSWYLHRIEPGRRYRAEIHFVDERGASRRVGRRSNPIGTPSEGPSPLVADRFLDLPWEAPLHREETLASRAVELPPVSPSRYDELFRLSGGVPGGAAPLGSSERAGGGARPRPTSSHPA